MTVQAPRRLFTVEEFDRMGEAGVFDEDDRIELLAGEIIQMTPIGPLHAASVDRLARELQQQVAAFGIVRVQNPIVLGSHSEPQPDISVLRYRSDFYRNRHPRPEDVLLVIEVADSSIVVDRGVKLPLYARAGIREYWIVDLTAAVVEVYRDPGPDGYRESLRLTTHDRLESALLPGFAVSVAELLG